LQLNTIIKIKGEDLQLLIEKLH